MSTPAPTPDENVTIDRAELEQLRATNTRMVNLDAYAKEAEIDTAEEYLEVLEEAAYTKPTTPEPTPTTPTPVPTPSGIDPNVQKQLDAAKRASAQAFLAAQTVAFNTAQSNLPEVERSPFSEKELLKIINNPDTSGLVMRSASKFNGNVFAAANYIATIDKGVAKAHEAGAAVATAKANAAATANLQTGGATPEPTSMTAEQKAQAEQDKAADAIASDDAPYEMPISK